MGAIGDAVVVVGKCRELGLGVVGMGIGVKVGIGGGWR